ncbi:uncharacterized protein LOC124198484 isoform X3 [Daphnia pulex]|uniref:uncharacterized protein LOC124198484 isoform X3 n=1 Tax=Daphnia pulex TaxID=6669 RepID=UPI001EDD0605|nr:uncharacterized protein LOC124198484 isoform X3 [Daphnia pulex]
MPGTLDEVNCCVSPTPTGSSGLSSPPPPASSLSPQHLQSHQDSLNNSQSSREFKDYNGIRSWGSRNNNSRSSSALDRHSESSESLDNHSTCSANGGRQMQDFIGSSEYIPTRSTKTAPKVAYNPMQFVKTGPTKLAKTAQEQLKKAEEVKKVRETKKDDAEDWQSNLEGWKSSRRKRQEHVIERVTEVKRMEQEEALKASEAATKRLINIREKRGKLSALYSVEDNDEIEFLSNSDECGTTTVASGDPVDSSPDSSVFNGDTSQNSATEQAASITNTVTTTPSDLGSHQGDEYTYEKSIEDYVKFSTSALSKQQQETRSTSSRTTWTKSSRMEQEEQRVEVVVKRQEATKVDQQPPQASDRNNKPTDNAAADLVMVKRRSVFERDHFTTAPDVDKASITAANRRSGEFSSTFKNRLSTFESTEAAAAAAVKTDAVVAPPPSRVTPDRDPHFKNKLANFHKVEETAATAPASHALPPPPAEADETHTNKPNFKAKLAAFRQVEEKAKSAPPPPTTTTMAAVKMNNKPAVAANKPVIPAVKPPSILRTAQVPQQQKAKSIEPIQPEPIYANSSVAMAGSSSSSTSGHQRVVVDAQPSYPSSGPPAGAGDAESYSDCTEDEGIRSLSPHGTPSPTSPTPNGMEPPEPLPPPLPSHPPIGYSPYSFQNQQQQREPEPVAGIADSPSPSSPQLAWPAGNAEAVVWDDWVVDLGSAVQNAAPPSEKPPPPPISNPPTETPIVVHHQSTSTTSTTPSTTTCHSATTCAKLTSGHPQLRRNEKTMEPAGLRQELRKRRSDFLGFDVNAMEDDAKELADAIPPPPDLKTLLRNSSTDYRASEFGLAEWQPPSPPHEEELARKEREIIETLEKEENERTVRSASAGLHNRSQDEHGIEYEMTAEIDQLAREWQTGSSIRRASTKFQPHQQESLIRPEGEVKQQLHVEVNHRQPHLPAPQQQQQHQQQSILVSPSLSSSSSSAGAVKQVSPQPIHPQQSQLSPPKPSRLSAAPKPKLHDGEAWMAKRKVASEGGVAGATATAGAGAAAGRKDMKDVSRHWLIQEAEQRRIDAMQERQRNYSPLSSSSSLQLTPPVRPMAHPATTQSPPAPSAVQPSSINNNLMAGTADGSHWMSRSSSSTSMDKMSELRLLGPNSKGGMDHSFRSTSSLGSSPTPRPLYANQEEILEYADFTGAPHTAPPVWQVRSLVSSGSMDQLQSIHHHHHHHLGSIQSPPSRPAKSQSQTLPSASSSSAMQQFSGNAAQTQPSWRSTHPPGETDKEPIAPLPHSVITTLTQRMTQRSNNNNNNANYGDYMNVQEATVAQQQQQQSAVGSTTRAGPQVPAQRPANYRHPSVVGPSHSAPVQSSAGVHQSQNNNDRMLSVSGKKKCSLCQEELGRGAAMIIESLRLFYHINCFRCCVCGIALGNGTAGTDVRVRNNNLHCHDCYSNDDGLKFSKV